ncbi:B12-binding domain-containing radical SAM protein [Sulfitobacter sp. R86518]|uniref:B12-binding domain-containing radical SAM protein n=1 Tax=Sulfitobacter sp. R86518 TaxID=3093858 RepID=UPI0036DA153C
MTVAIFFPPIVSSGFGAYYPSLAVLSGHLTAWGHKVQQFDLNTEAAEYLLAPEHLERLGQGYFFDESDKGDDTAAMPSTAARLIQKNRALLYSDNGGIQFAERASAPGYLLSALSQPFQFDETVPETLAVLSEQGVLVRWYSAFYKSLNLTERIATDVALIGISVPMGPQLLPALILCLHLKRLRPKAKVIFGGPTMSLMQDEALALLLDQCREVDAVVRYDGEGPIAMLADQALSEDWEPTKVPGTSALVRERVRHLPPAPGPKLAEIPFADYDPALVRRLEKPELGIIQTRGCYWGRCAYCDFVELYEGSPKYRGRSANSFVAEVEAQISKHKTRKFSLITEAIPPSFALRFSKLILDKGIDISWNSFAMVDRHFSPEHFEAMAASGCDHLVIGLETMSDRVLQGVEKYATCDDNEAFLRDASEAGISLYINLIPNLPTTTYQDAIDSLNKLEEIAHTLTSVAVFPFEATRSSQIGRTPEKFGLKLAKTETSEGQALFADNHLSVEDPAMSADELQEVIVLYQDFADRVSARQNHKTTTPREKAVGVGSRRRLLVAENDVDLQCNGDELHIFNWRTREKWVASQGLLPIYERAQSFSNGFCYDDLIGNAHNPDELVFLIDVMSSKGIFLPFDQ